MADQESEFVAKIASGISGLNARAWDRLAGSDPFLSRAFLSSLEDSGSVGPGTGWTPAPILIEDEASHLVSAAPAYLKTHSQGEYVFDHGWADAWERAGGQYYPKLQVAVPFTPVPRRGCSARGRSNCSQQLRQSRSRTKSLPPTSRSSTRRGRWNASGAGG